MCNKMPLAIFLLVLIIGAAAADLFMVMEKREEIVKPISEHIIIYSAATNEPYFGKRMKPWKEPEVHTCLPGQDGCGAVFKVNGEEVDYWQWKLEQEMINN